jgi:translation initiation factor IF-3
LRSTTISKLQKSKFPNANLEIKAQRVRLVGEDGEMIGIVPLREALQKANEAALDLVEISPQAEPPVCKLMNFGKYKYEQKKKQHDSKKKQHVVHLKEIKFRPNISQHDFDVKMRSIIKFLEDGDKVKISLKFKGREIVHNDIAMQIFFRVKENTAEIAKVESDAKLDGKQILMFLSPTGN